MRLAPSHQQLYELSKRSQGDLAEVPFALLLRAHWEHERDVTLVFYQGTAAKSVTLRQGAPVRCDSNQSHEWLGRLLSSQRLIAPSDLDACLDLAQESSRPLGSILVERGLIEAVELDRFLRKGLAAKLLDLFSWTRGEFTVRTDAAGDAPAYQEGVSVPRMLLTGITRYMPIEAIEARLRPFADRPLTATPTATASLDLTLSEVEHLIATTLSEAPRTLAELSRAVHLRPADTARVVYALAILGLVGVDGELRDEPASDPRSTNPMERIDAADDDPSPSTAQEAAPTRNDKRSGGRRMVADPASVRWSAGARGAAASASDPWPGPSPFAYRPRSRER